MIFANGDVYEGMWQAGQKHGRGKYRWKNEVVFEGQFWLDKREGEGMLSYPDGFSVEGYWRGDIRSKSNSPKGF